MKRRERTGKYAKLIRCRQGKGSERAGANEAVCGKPQQNRSHIPDETERGEGRTEARAWRLLCASLLWVDEVMADSPGPLSHTPPEGEVDRAPVWLETPPSCLRWANSWPFSLRYCLAWLGTVKESSEPGFSGPGPSKAESERGRLNAWNFSQEGQTGTFGSNPRCAHRKSPQ